MSKPGAVAAGTPGRSRLRRLLTGLTVSAVTLVVLLVVLELVARAWVAREIFSFKPVYTQDQVAGYRFKPNLSEYALGADLASNSIGRRGPEWAFEKPAGVFRIALIGDSLAFGFGVEFERTFGQVAARRIRQEHAVRCEVLNFAVPGYNTRQEARVLEQVALHYQPDLVLVLTCSNDHDDPLWVDAEGYAHWGQRGQPDTRVESVDLPSQTRWGILRRSALFTWVRLVWRRYNAQRLRERDRERHGEPPPGDWTQPFEPGPVSERLRDAVLEPLVGMAQRCRARGVPVVLLLFAGSPDYRRMAAAFQERTGHPVLHLLTLFPEAPNWETFLQKFSLGWDSHPNPEAHRRWANGLVDLLVKRKLLPAR